MTVRSTVEASRQRRRRYCGSRNGAIGSLHASWISRARLDIDLTVVGTEGTLHLDSSHATHVATGGREAAEGRRADRVPDLYAGFVDAVATGDTAAGAG